MAWEEMQISVLVVLNLCLPWKCIIRFEDIIGWKCNFSMNPNVRLIVWWLFGRLFPLVPSVCHTPLKRQGSYTSMLLLEHLFLQIIHVICQNMKKCVKQIIQLSYDETFLYARLCIFWTLCFPHCPAEGFIHLCIHKADSSVPLGVSDFWFGNDVPKSNVLKHPLFITSQQKSDYLIMVCLQNGLKITW